MSSIKGINVQGMTQEKANKAKEFARVYRALGGSRLMRKKDAMRILQKRERWVGVSGARVEAHSVYCLLVDAGAIVKDRLLVQAIRIVQKGAVAA